MPSLSARVLRLEAGRPDALANAVDRPPRETCEEWLERIVFQLRGEMYDSGDRNAYGETRTDWLARRYRELGVTP